MPNTCSRDLLAQSGEPGAARLEKARPTRKPGAVVRLAAALAVIGLLAAIWAVPIGGASASQSRVSERVYVVRPGDTLWSLAKKLEPGRDPRALMDQLIAETGSPVIHPGQRIRVPQD